MIAQTERLYLRKLQDDDFEWLLQAFNRPDVMKYYGHFRDKEQTRVWMKYTYDGYEKYNHGKWIIVRKSDSQPIGHTGLLKITIDNIEEVELGYFLDSPFWHKGYATEAAKAALQAGLNLGYRRIVSAINPENLPSIEVAKRLRMQKEKQGLARAGEMTWVCDVYVYNPVLTL